jgi:hypothetical protein
LSVRADLEPDLAKRIPIARRAFELRGHDAIGVYAMYSAAVDAYNAEQYTLALELAEAAAPFAGALKGPIDDVRQSSRDALEVP